MNLALDSLLLGMMVVIAATGLLFTLLAYLSSRSKRVLILLSVFSMFLVKGILLVISDLSDLLDLSRLPPAVLVIDIVVMGMLILSGFLE